MWREFLSWAIGIIIIFLLLWNGMTSWRDYDACR
jgi:hypothetical protein